MRKKRVKNKKLRDFLQWFEHFIDRIIPFLLIVLAFLLIVDNPFWTLIDLEHYEPWVTIFDGLVVLFFVIDLTYKWFRTRKIRKFLKLYWLDIIAVMPFYLAFRAYTQFAAFFVLSEEITETAQKFAHEAVLLRETELLKEARIAKEARLLREARPVFRSLRAMQRLLRATKGRLYTSYHALIHSYRSHRKR